MENLYIQQNVTRRELYVAAMRIQSCLACQLVLQQKAPHLACHQGHVLGEDSPGLSIVVADRPRSHEGPAGVLAAICVKCSVSEAEC